MGRKAKWRSGETVAIRVPKALSERVLAQAQAWDAADCPETSKFFPVNPYRVEFESVGETRQGKVTGVLVDWLDGGVVSAVLVNCDGDGQQTQVPIERVEFLDIPDFVRKKAGETLPPYLVTVEEANYQLKGGYFDGSTLEQCDRACDWLIEYCDRVGLDPKLVYQRLVETWLEPLDISA